MLYPPLAAPEKLKAAGFDSESTYQDALRSNLLALNIDLTNQSLHYTSKLSDTPQDLKRFLNRISAMPVRVQNTLFDQFVDGYDLFPLISWRFSFSFDFVTPHCRYDKLVREAQEDGTMDNGVINLNRARGIKVWLSCVILFLIHYCVFCSDQVCLSEDG